MPITNFYITQILALFTANFPQIIFIPDSLINYCATHFLAFGRYECQAGGGHNVCITAFWPCLGTDCLLLVCFNSLLSPLFLLHNRLSLSFMFSQLNVVCSTSSSRQQIWIKMGDLQDEQGHWMLDCQTLQNIVRERQCKFKMFLQEPVYRKIFGIQQTRLIGNFLCWEKVLFSEC